MSLLYSSMFFVIFTVLFVYAISVVNLDLSYIDYLCDVVKGFQL